MEYGSIWSKRTFDTLVPIGVEVGYPARGGFGNFAPVGLNIFGQTTRSLRRWIMMVSGKQNHQSLQIKVSFLTWNLRTRWEERPDAQRQDGQSQVKVFYVFSVGCFPAASLWPENVRRLQEDCRGGTSRMMVIIMTVLYIINIFL